MLMMEASNITFRDMGLSEAMLKALEKKGYGYPTTIQSQAIPELMQENLHRIKGDLDRFVMKNDYRNASLPWENAMDAVPRGMQKLQGGHPADPVFRNSDFGIRK